MLPSLAAKMGQPALRDTGLPQQVEIFRDVRARTGETPPVLDAEDVLEDPRGVLERFCAARRRRLRRARCCTGRPGRRPTDGDLGEALVRRGRALDRLRAVRAAAAPGGAGAATPLLAECLALYEELAAHRLRGLRARCCNRSIEKNRDLIVNINGRLVHRDEAGVSPFDSAVQGGDAVWEGLRLYDGRIFRLRAAPRSAAAARRWRWRSATSRRTTRSPPRSAGRWPPTA